MSFIGRLKNAYARIAGKFFCPRQGASSSAAPCAKGGAISRNSERAQESQNRASGTVINAPGAGKNGSKTESVLSVLKNALTLLDTLAGKITTRSIVRTAYASSAETFLERLNQGVRPLVRPIVRISKNGVRSERVWDIEVEGCHEFFTPDFLAHNCSLLDELDDLNNSNADDNAFEAMKAVNERTRQPLRGYRRPFIVVGTTSQGQRGLYRIYTQFKKSGTAFTLIRGRTQDNVFLMRKDPTFVRSLYKMYTPKEALVFLEGQFLSVTAGRVFPDFDWDRNYINVPMDLQTGEDETVYAAMDFNDGYNRATAFILRNGIIYGVKRYEFPSAREMPLVLRHDFPRNKIIFIPDSTSSKEVISFLRELRKYGITWVARSKNPNVEDTAFLCNKLMYLGRLIFTQAAKETAEACAGFMRDKNHQIPPGKGPRDYAHDADSVRYCCMFLVLTRYEFRDVRRATIERRIKQMQDAEEPEIKELEAGYVEINAQAMDLTKTAPRA